MNVTRIKNETLAAMDFKITEQQAEMIALIVHMIGLSKLLELRGDKAGAECSDIIGASMMQAMKDHDGREAVIHSAFREAAMSLQREIKRASK